MSARVHANAPWREVASRCVLRLVLCTLAWAGDLALAQRVPAILVPPDAARQARGAAQPGTAKVSEVQNAVPEAATKSPPLANSANTLRFRRVGAPVGAALGTDLLPMRRGEFERLVRQLSGEASDLLQQSMLAAAHFEASVQSDGHVEGVARLAIVHRQSDAVLLPLSPWSLAIGSAAWEDDHAPAYLGCDPRGRVALLVDRTGVLQVAWTSRGQLNPEGINWDLPWCADSQVSLDLPPGLQPICSQGVVSPASPSVGLKSATRNRWIWRGHGGPLRIRLEPADPLKSAQPWVSRTAIYRASPAGLEIETELRLDGGDAPLTQLLLRATADMRVVQASVDGQALEVAEDAVRPQFYHLRFPDALSGSEHVVKVRSFGGLTYDELWTLPVLLAPLARWRQSESEVFLDGALELRDALTRGCRQTSDVNDASGRSLTFIHDREPPEIRLQLARRQPRLKVVSGTQVRWEGRQLLARVAADVEVDYGELFSIQATVREPWIVDSVTTQPETALDANTLSTRVEQERLILPLARPLRVQQPIRVTILAHRRAPDQGEGLRGDQLAAVRFPEAIESRELMTIDAEVEGAYALGDFPRPIGLSRRELDLLTPTPDALIFRNTENLHQVTVRPKSGAPRFSGDIRVRVDARRPVLEESYDVRIEPRGGALQRLLVRFSQSRETAPSFWLRSATSVREITARRLRAAEAFEGGSGSASGGEAAASEGGEAGELWQLDLPAGQSTPFHLTCQRRTPGEKAQSCALLSLPDAERATASLVVLTDTREPLTLAVSGLQPDLASDNDPSCTSAAFRYEPRKAAELRLVRSSDPESRLEDVWVWSRRIHTRISDSGELLHRADFLVESLGRRPLQISLPDTVAYRRLEFDGQPLDVAPSSAANSVVTPPPHQRFFRLTLYYVEHLQPRPGPVALRWTPRAPQINARVLSDSWRVTLAPTFRAWYSATDHSSTANWQRRLLGPLSAWTTHAPWRPWDAPAASQPPEAVVNQLLEKADAALAKLANDSQPTLGQWLQELLTAGNLWIDEPALTYRGLTRQTPLTPRVYSSAHRVLEAFGLRLQRRGERLLLTTRDGPSSDEAYFWIPCETWLQEPIRTSPWPAEADRTHLGLVSGDGQSLALGHNQRLIVLRSNWLQAVAWCTVLAATGLGIMLWWWRPSSPLLLALVCGVATLLSPQALSAQFASAAMWGALLAWAIGVCRQRGVSLESPRLVGINGTAPLVALGALAAWGAALASAPQHAAAQVADDPPVPPIYEVVSLLKKDGNPADDYVYMPHAFQDALLRAEQEAQRADAWLLTKASYTYQPAADEPETTAAQLTASLAYWVRMSNAAIEYPLPAPGWELIEATVNGRPAGVFLDVQRGVFSWRPGESGEQRLRLTWRSHSGVALAPLLTNVVHPCPQATLDIVAPPSDRLARDQALWAQAQWNPVDRVWRAELGPSRQLQLPRLASPRPAENTQADALYWLRIRPKSVVLDARLRFQAATNGQLAKVSLVTDPGVTLRWARSEQIESSEAVVETVAGGVRWTWNLRAPVSEAQLEVSFHCKGLSGIGVVQLPRLAPEVDQVLRRWAAISVQNGLVLDVLEQSLSGRPLPPARFAQDWPGDEAPDLAMELAGATLPLLPVRFAASRAVADETLDIVARAESLDLGYRADISGADPLLLQHRVELPSGLRNLRVRLDDGRGETPIRTARSPNGSLLSVFLDRPAQGPQILSIQGQLPLPSGASIQRQRRLPTLELQGCEADHYLVRIHRASDVGDVSLSETTGLTPLDLPPESTHDLQPDQRLLRVFRREPARGSLPASLTVRPNQALADGSLLTRMQRDAGVWSAELQVRARVRRGVLDTLWLDAPTTWAPPFTCSPAAEITLHDAPEEGRRFLAITPTNPLEAGSPVRFTVQAALSDSGNAPPAAPDIVPLNFTPRFRFVALPKLDGQQSIAWEINGLQAIRAPASFSIGREDEQTYDFYRVTSSPFRAGRMRVEPISGLTRVRLAEHRFLCTSAEKHILGVTSLLVEPGGRRQAVLVSPYKIHVLSVRVDGQPAPAQAVDGFRCELSLRHDQLPQWIEVLYLQPLAETGASRLGCLTLEDAPVERSTCIVAPPAGYQAVAAGSVQATPISTMDELQLQWQSLLAALQSASDILREEPTETQRQWILMWSALLNDASHSAQRIGHYGMASAAIADLNARQQQLISQVSGSAPESWPSKTRMPFVLESAQQLAVHAQDWASPLRLSKQGSFDSVRLQLEPQASNRAAVQRYVAAAILLAAGFLVLRIRHWVWLQETLVRSPGALVVLVGAAWWLLFAPSFAGWLLITLAVLSSWRFPWPRRYV